MESISRRPTRGTKGALHARRTVETKKTTKLSDSPYGRRCRFEIRGEQEALTLQSGRKELG